MHLMSNLGRRIAKISPISRKNGFKAAMCSDHFHPRGEKHGESGFAWSWLGAALNSISIPYGVVNAPGQRYYSAIIAQAAATIAEMYENRFWLAVGSGQLLNDGITGDNWPPKSERNERLKQSAEIIKRLWNGEKVTFNGYVKIEDAKSIQFLQNHRF